MVLQKLSIDACAERTDWKLQTSGMSISLKKFESKKVKILWDFSIQTNHQLEQNKLDLVAVDRQQAVCQIIDISIPGDARVEPRERKLVSLKTWQEN